MIYILHVVTLIIKVNLTVQLLLYNWQKITTRIIHSGENGIRDVKTCSSCFGDLQELEVKRELHGQYLMYISDFMNFEESNLSWSWHWFLYGCSYRQSRISKNYNVRRIWVQDQKISILSSIVSWVLIWINLIWVREWVGKSGWMSSWVWGCEWVSEWKDENEMEGMIDSEWVREWVSGWEVWSIRWLGGSVSIWVDALSEWE